MWFRLANYVVALLFLGSASVVYQNVVAPKMMPPEVDRIGIPKGKDIDASDPALNDLFADGAWQRGTCKRLQTSDGMLLFQNWKQVSSDQWKLWPMTVVIGRGMSGEANGDPIIIDAPQGADIKFSGPLDVMSGGAPPIQNGTMVGNVHIYRQSKEKRSFDLKTANVGIDKRKIWTTEEINMQVGTARLIGRDLTLSLASAAATSTGGSPTAILDRMDLIYLDELVMPLHDGRLWEPVPGQDSPPPSALISLRCGGRVVYDFAIDYLTLKDSVSLIHQVPGDLADRFDCQELALKLNDPTNDEIERHGPLDWIREVVATGSPAVFNVPSYDCELMGDRIVFNASKGLLEASGAKGIKINRGGINASLAKLVYRFDPMQPTVIGEIIAAGAGIVSISDPKLPLRKARWLDGFHLRPAGNVTTEQVSDKQLTADVEVWVKGTIEAWLNDGGEFKADSIEGVMSPKTVQVPATPTKPASTKQTLVPKYFEIKGNVHIDTVAIEAATKEMKLLFVDESPPPPQETGEGDATSPVRSWVAQPGQTEGLVSPIARPRPKIVGDKINAQLRLEGLTAKKLSVTGSVVVTHELKTGEITLPARLTGEQLQLIDGGGEDVLQLGSGVDSPARFELGDGFFVGPQIQIRPSDNLVWINAAGEFQMPTAALPTGLAGEPNDKLQWTKPPHCRWLGEMIFDGRRAVLTDGVEITAALINNSEPWELLMTGDRLQVDLASDVAVRDVQSVRGAVVESISLMEAENRPVMVQAIQRATDNVQEAKHLIHAKKLTLTPGTVGTLVGAGPGWYRGWMRPVSNDAFLGRKSKPATAEEAKGLTGIHLVFNDSMQANMSTRNLDFLRGVRVGVRSVANWEEGFDANAMDMISLGDSTLDCDRLRFNIEPGFSTKPASRISRTRPPTPWELEASSGVFFRTRDENGLLETTASRVTYSSSKDLFTISGVPNRPAIFRQTMPDGSKGQEGAVQTMTIRPKTMTIENAILERWNIASPPTNGPK